MGLVTASPDTNDPPASKQTSGFWVVSVPASATQVAVTFTV